MTLERYVELSQYLKVGLDGVGAPASFYSPLNIIGRLALGKWTLESRDGHWGFVSGDTVRVIPTGDKAEYYHAIIAWSARHTVQFVPAYMADALRNKGFKVTKIQDEYILHPDKLAKLEGGALRGLRSDRNRALNVVTVDQADVQSLAPRLLELNAAWYKEAKDRLWRPSEKAHIDWLISNWSLVQEIEPSATCVLVQCQQYGCPISMEMGSHLSTVMASSFTQRSDRELLTGAYSGSNLIATLALSMLLQRPSNDGSADTPALAQRKTKMASQILTFYSVERK